MLNSQSPGQDAGAQSVHARPPVINHAAEAAVIDHFLATLRDPERTRQAAERDARNERIRAAEAAYEALMPADTDLAAIVNVAVEICDRIEAHARWHCEREEACELPQNSRACTFMAEFMYECNELRDRLPDAADDTLKAMYNGIVKLLREVGDEANYCFVFTAPDSDAVVFIGDELTPVAIDHFLEITDGDLRELVDALGGVLDRLRWARAGFEWKLCDVDYGPDTKIVNGKEVACSGGRPPDSISFVQVPLSTTSARIQALEIGFETPGYPPKSRSNAEDE